jgi:Tol biopolymer transport system component
MRFIADGKPVLAMAAFLAATSSDTHAFAAPKTEVGTLTRISVSAAGAQGNNNSYGVAWSPDSKSVVFYTQATNLFPTPDPNQATYVAQVTLATGQVADLTIGTPTGLKGASTYTGCTLCQTHPEFSADGQWLTFYAQRANGLSSLDTSGKFSIYVRNMTSGASQLVSLGANGAAANANAYFPQMAPAGTFVVFSSDATNMVAGRNTRARGLYTYTLATGTTAPLTSATGAYPNGGLAEPVISADGTQLAFSSNATNFAAMPAGSTNVLVKSFATGAVTVASSSAAGVVANGLSTHPQWCSTGAYLAFQTNATSLGGDGKTLQVYVKDMRPGGTSVTMVSTDAQGNPGNGSSSHAVWSPDCTRLAMDTAATNFAANSPAGSQQIAVKNLVTGSMTVVSLTQAGLPATGNSNHAQWSPDGSKIAFASSASNLVGNDTNRRSDVFVTAAP